MCTYCKFGGTKFLHYSSTDGVVLVWDKGFSIQHSIFGKGFLWPGRDSALQLLVNSCHSENCSPSPEYKRHSRILVLSLSMSRGG